MLAMSLLWVKSRKVANQHSKGAILSITLCINYKSLVSLLIMNCEFSENITNNHGGGVNIVMPEPSCF